MKREIVARALGWGVFGFAVVVVACTPAQRDAARELAGPAVRAACVLVRALADDGTPRELCATAEDLLPVLEELLSEREERERVRAALVGAPVEVAAPRVAFAFPEVPKARAPRRRCVVWAATTAKTKNASSLDAAAEAGDAAEGGSDDAGR